MRRYAGWLVHGHGDQWQATQFGVRMRANSESLIIWMIDYRPPLRIFHHEQLRRHL